MGFGWLGLSSILSSRLRKVQPVALARAVSGPDAGHTVLILAFQQFFTSAFNLQQSLFRVGSEV